MSPEVYKESGETRLYANEGRILLVLPSCPWTLLLYEWQDIDGFKLLHSIPLEWVETSVIGNYHSVEITKKFTIHIFAKKNREIDQQSTEVQLVSRNIFHVIVNFSFFHTVR